MQKTQLRTSVLGRTGLEVTRVGFGAWAIGGGGWEFGWGPQQDDASRPGRPAMNPAGAGPRAA
jgi:aryl-alcohol dehydrogenase-like predicted oxidoreductase